MKATRVLIYYDHLDSYKWIEAFLNEEEQHKLVLADNLAKAKNLLTNEQFDGVIMIGVADTVKAYELYCFICELRVPLTLPVFHIGYQNEQIISLCYEQKVDAFFTVPYDLQDIFNRLLSRIQFLIEMKKMQAINVITGLYSESFLEKMYHLQIADLARIKSPFTLILVTLENLQGLEYSYGAQPIKQVYASIGQYIAGQIRDSDLAFQLDREMEIAIMLRHTRENEAMYFINRLKDNFPTLTVQTEGVSRAVKAELVTSIIEIGNASVTFKEAIGRGRDALKAAVLKGSPYIEIVERYKQFEIEKIKVSIIEHDDVTRDILRSLLERMAFDHAEIGLQLFEDGVQFLESAWYRSPHKHIILLADVLPKMDGFEVLHALRQMPNSGKFMIMMLSTRNTENDMIYAFQRGVDDYIAKPLQLKLVESLIRRYTVR